MKVLKLLLISSCLLTLFQSCSEGKKYFPHERVLKIGDDATWSNPDLDHGDWDKDAFTSEKGIFWVRFKINSDEKVNELTLPGIQMISIGSYQAFWDGHLLYENGRVGRDKVEEIPGQFISHFPIPDSLLEKGEHTLALRVSNYHTGIFRGSWNTFYIEEFQETRINTLRLTAFMLILAGMYLIASIYYFLIYLNKNREPIRLLFSIMCFFFFGLIFMEFYKFLVPYPYYFHYYRLTIIGILTIGTSFIVPFFLWHFFEFSRRMLLGMIFLSILISYSFYFGIVNDRTTWGLSTIMLYTSILITSIGVFRKKQGSKILLITLLSILLISRLFSYQINHLIYNYDINLFVSFTILVLTILYLMAQKFKIKEAAYENSLLRSARLQNELLKKNIRPHFLMNTLTSIMEWVEVSPKKSIQFMEALADEFEILNQIADLKLIPITQEIELCKKHLEVMGFRKEINYEWIDENIEPLETIPPATLHTLVENGITHNKAINGKIVFKLTFSNQTKTKTYCLEIMGENRNNRISKGNRTGLKYVKSRLSESYGEDWTLVSGPYDQGWKTEIQINKA